MLFQFVFHNPGAESFELDKDLWSLLESTMCHIESYTSLTGEVFLMG